MPIKSLRLINFKCFENSGEIPIAPLTLIFGRNNSGKSSILQSLLLLKQTIDSPAFGPRLNLRGPTYDAGTFADVVHKHKLSQHLEFRLKFDLPGPAVGSTSEIVFEFCSDEPQTPKLVRLEVRRSNNLPL